MTRRELQLSPKHKHTQTYRHISAQTNTQTRTLCPSSILLGLRAVMFTCLNFTESVQNPRGIEKRGSGTNQRT